MNILYYLSFITNYTEEPHMNIPYYLSFIPNYTEEPYEYIVLPYRL